MKAYAFAILMIILAACAPAGQKIPEPAAEVPETPVAASAVPKAEAPPAPKEDAQAKPAEYPEPTREPSKQLQEILAKADQKLKSYRYLELIVPDKQQPDTMFIKGNRIKIKLFEYDPYIPDEYFDTVYLDTSERTIVGRCESRKRCIWIRGDNTKKEWTNLNYEEYLPKTPYQWVKEAPPTAEVLGPEVRENRQATKIEYDLGGEHFIMSIDDSYGVPLKIVRTKTDGSRSTYHFNDAQFNTLTDADVTPPKIS